MSAGTEAVCTSCGLVQQTKPTKKGNPRLPRGWKEHMGVWCRNCWRRNWRLRAITFRVAGPVDGEWSELRDALSECWRNAAAVANWAVRELSRADVVRTPEMDKLPPMPAVYLYPGAREVAPEMDTASVVSLLQAVERKYRARRHDVVWLRKASPPSYRYPTPYPVHNQRWSAHLGADEEALITVPLAGRRWTLRLAGGEAYYRQRAAFLQLMRGEAIQGELSLYQVSGSTGDHRTGIGGRRQSRLMAKLVMWLPAPAPEADDRRGTLYVRTAPDSLLVYRINMDESRCLHADQARRWAAEHRQMLQRLSDDTKAEKRRPRRARRGIDARRQASARRYRRRMDSLTHEATAMIAGYAQRRKVASVVYDDTDKSYVPDGFPWADLRTKLAYKLAGMHIPLEIASGEVEAETPDPLESAD